jgi:hypothetical protein
MMGSFDPAFLELPEGVIIATIRANQKCFCLRDASGKLAPKFIITANTEATDGGAVITAGNERVIRARLSDAAFFYKGDLSLPLEHGLPKLEDTVFHAKLGSQFARVERLVKLAGEIIRHRRELIPKLSPLARLAYRRISNDAEELRIAYEPNVKNDFAVELAQVRDRERRFRATLLGPHRDDLQLLLNEKSAAQFGSEGQKRTLAIALKMAQAEYLTGIHGSAPVLLIDDVMGELDVKRRSGLLPLLERARETSGQVFMTCTEENWPRELGRELQRWEVKAGALAGH